MERFRPTNTVKSFIQEHSELINSGKFDDLYKILLEDHGDFTTGEFTYVLLLANINPLDFLDYVPQGYLFEREEITHIIIPNNIKQIRYKAFFGCINLSYIELPDSIELIPWAAFNCCSNLKEIKLPQFLKIIERGAFWHSGLESINLPDGLEEIGARAFNGCKNLKFVELPKSLKTVGQSLFINCSSDLKVFYKGSKEEWEKVKGHDQIGWDIIFEDK